MQVPDLWKKEHVTSYAGFLKGTVLDSTLEESSSGTVSPVTDKGLEAWDSILLDVFPSVFLGVEACIL